MDMHAFVEMERFSCHIRFNLDLGPESLPALGGLWGLRQGPFPPGFWAVRQGQVAAGAGALPAHCVSVLPAFLGPPGPWTLCW